VDLQARLQSSLLLSILPLFPISGRLAYLQILQHDDLSVRVEHSTERRSIEILPRGRFLDRGGRVLADSLPAWSAFLDLKVLREDPNKMRSRIERVSAALDLSASDIDRIHESKRRTVWLKRRIGLRQLDALKALKLRAVGIVPDERRHYPNGDLARSLVGQINSDGRGISGLEYAFNKQLSGRAIRWKLTRDGAGRAILLAPEYEAPRPPDLRLTIDRSLQYVAETQLAETVHKHKAKSGILLIQDPHSGEILAMASYPSNPLKNPAVQDVFEPGSTFKLITAAAALETATLKPGETIFCEMGKWQMTPKVRVKDHDPLGALNLDEIIQYSSNIGSAKLGIRLGAEIFHKFCRLFGFGYKTGIPLPAESAGLMKMPKNMRKVRLANAAFGQGLAVTAVQMVTAYSAIANGGTLMEPRVVESVGTGNRRGAVKVRRVVTPATAARLQEMLELVVRDGTGASAQVPGYTVAGKTGTAQKIDPETGTYSTSDYISSFAGYVPARDPRFTILSIIDSPRVGYYGSEVAAPLWARVARRILALKGVPPDQPLLLRMNKGTRPQPTPKPPLPPRRPLPRPSLLKGAKDSPAPSVRGV
jgi:cell division protein FtsI (penicillin-binding protein 3)